MTLREIRAAHPGLFYRQDWYEREAFMDRHPSGVLTRDFTVHPYRLHPFAQPIYAVDFAAVYVTCPDDPRWRHDLPTDDVDQYGNRVYVGSVGKNGCEGFQIHRVLTPQFCYVTP
jgi:hypothetical protein